MCEREDIRIDVSDKPDSVNMAKFWWKFMFQKIAKDYPGYDKVHIVYFDEQYTLKGLLVDGDDPNNPIALVDNHGGTPNFDYKYTRGTEGSNNYVSEESSAYAVESYLNANGEKENAIENDGKETILFAIVAKRCTHARSIKAFN